MAALFRKLPRFFLPGLVVVLSGCSTLGIRFDSRLEALQKRESRRVAATVSPSSPAADLLRSAQARGLRPEDRLGFLLGAAKAAEPEALRGEGDAREIYNAAVGQVVAILHARGFGNRTIAGTGGSWRLEISGAGKGVLDPLQPTAIVAAAGVRISGIGTRAVQPGPGVPYVFSYKQNSPFLAGQPGIAPFGVSVPATALLTFGGGKARLTFHDPLWSDQIVIRHRKVRLAADFSAPIAVLLSRSANRSIDLRAFLFTRQMFGRAGLFQFQPYDPQKIPVVFVHGLLSRPEAWTRALNGLLDDPGIRRRYQFWFLLYPTGLPVWKSAALLRSELDRFQCALPKDGPDPRRVVLIGHSMGGVISSLIIRQGGDRLWNQFFATQVDHLPLSPEAKYTIGRLIYFPPRSDISRVIFIATPHRGSALATNPLAGFLARLVRLPELLSRADRAALLQAVDRNARHLIAMPVNSIRFLQADSPLLTAIQRLPLSRDIPYHSIIGDRGRGDAPGGGDGVVPYRSAHLESAASEKIIPSGHGANEHPAGIAEIRRILLEAEDDRR